jgi:peptidyl-dipeptidase A
MRGLLALTSLLVTVVALTAGAEEPNVAERFRSFLRSLEPRVAPLARGAALAGWDAAVTGKPEAYAKQAELQTKLESIFTSKEDFAFLKQVRDAGVVTDPLEKRQLDQLVLAYTGRQIDPKLLESIIAAQTAVEQKFNTFRGKVGGKEVTDNQIEETLQASKDRAQRKSYYLASKQVGATVASDLVALVKLRNEAASKLGFRDYYAMQLALGEQDEAWLLKLFDELDSLTAAPFATAKAHIDQVQGDRLGVKDGKLEPWDYTDRFFQEAPNLTDADPDKPLADKDLAAEVGRFYRSIGLDADPILAKSDLYEKPGKYPHAFCTDIDRNGDVRTLQNLKANQYWLDTMLHELGHGVYSYNVSRSLPYFLRSEDHTFTTEGVAMLMGRLSSNAAFYNAMGWVDGDGAAALSQPLEEKLRLHALIFSRWCQVMLRFEKELYGNPDQDLDGVWWRLVERYQLLRRPAEWPKGGWASKIHIATVPVYYHNYQLGDLYASQLHLAICTALYPGQNQARVVYVGDPRVGAFLKEKVFASGASLPWPEFVKASTGQELSAKAFAAQLVAPKHTVRHRVMPVAK